MTTYLIRCQTLSLKISNVEGASAPPCLTRKPIGTIYANEIRDFGSGGAGHQSNPLS